MTLFDEPPLPGFDDVRGLARYGDPQTSLDAAAQITGRTELAILETFAARGHGLTDDEVVALLPALHGPTVKSARSRLSRAGRLADSGRVRPSQRGCDQTVWILSNEPSI